MYMVVAWCITLQGMGYTQWSVGYAGYAVLAAFCIRKEYTMYVVVAWCITLQGRGIHSGWSGMRGNKSGYACGTDDSSQQFPQPPYVTKHATFPNMELGTSSNGIAIFFAKSSFSSD